MIRRIIIENCRLCQSHPGIYHIQTDKLLIRDIYDYTKIKITDKLNDSLPSTICEYCRKSIISFRAFKENVRKVDRSLKKLINKIKEEKVEIENWKCDKCPAEFNNEDSLLKHQASHNEDEIVIEETKLNCLNCGKVFIKLEEYGFHKCAPGNDNDIDTFCEDPKTGDEKKTKTKNFMCSYKNCKKILTSAYSLKTHHLKHQGKRSFLCVTCGKSFITKNSLTCHEKIHLDVKSYYCELCNIGFSVRSNLRAHEKKHHEGIKFYCSQCTRAFSSKCGLERHERIHSGIKEFKCETCPAAFYTNKELLKHQRYHLGVKAHKCEQCFKTFFERHHLIIHLRSHTGERPYVCQFADCGKAFVDNQKLKRHHNAKHST